MDVLKAVDRVLDRIYDVCGLVAAGLLIVLTGLVLASIVARLVSVFIPGVTEFAGYTMAACMFFAMAYAFRSGGHIRVTLFTSRMTGRARRINELWCLGAMAFIVSYLAYYLCELAYDSWDYGEISEGGDALPLWIPQAPTALGSVVFAVCCVHTFVRALVLPETLAEIDSKEGAEV